MFKKLLRRVILPVAKKIVQRELDKKTGGVVQLDEVIDTFKKVT